MHPEQPHVLLGAPGALFYSACAGASLILLYAVSVPGISVFAFAFACLCLLALAAVWLIKLARIRRTSPRSQWTYLIAPVGGALVLMLVVLDLPFQARWSLSRDSFASEIDSLPAAVLSDEDADLPGFPRRLGLYSITQAYRVHGGVIFYEATGNFFDDAGFAYLPKGPTPDLETGSFESPEFHHLGGSWYSWNASW